MAANDGMLHALNGDTGQELWAYVPRIVMPNLHKLANANWGATHRFSVDGSPHDCDVFVGGAWKTILVAGLNSGGRGYYALDVTDPGDPEGAVGDLLRRDAVRERRTRTWASPTATRRSASARPTAQWVVYVTSGINNVAPGDGKGYLYVLDIATGAVLNKVRAPARARSTAPLGLNRIAGFADNLVHRQHRSR